MRHLLIFLICTLLAIPLLSELQAGGIKWIRVGKYQTKIVDSGDQGEQSGEGTFSYYYYNKFTYSLIDHAGWQLGTNNWTDENGNTLAVKISGAGHGSADESINTIPVPDADGISIRQFRRYPPPTITVDGERVDTPFPLTAADEVNPDYIDKWGGSADIMVESKINTSMGVTIKQRVFGWSQENHDDYIIYDWTFVNTGNIDLDSDIELDGQSLTGVYFFRANNFRTGASRPWNDDYGSVPGDSLRMVYAFPQRSSGAERDDLGAPLSTGFLNRATAIGEATLHADSPNSAADDPSQPKMTDHYTAEILWAKLHAEATSDADHARLYDAMQFGSFDGGSYQTGTYPNTYHGLPLTERGVQFVDEFPWWNWRACSYTAAGPYDIAFGDSIRIVWATVCGSISPEKGWEIGKAWQEGNAAATWNGQYKNPAPYDVFGDDLAPTDNDKAKDSWVLSGIDSLFANAYAATWNVQNNYQAPEAPPAPSIEITSLPDKIIISWGTEAEVASDLAGYRIYRAIGSPDTTFNLIGSAAPGVFTFDDETANTGENYYYYVTAYDDGSGNTTGVHGPGESLESGSYLNRTTKAAVLKTPAAEDLSEVRIVPNPFNVNARDLNYTGDAANKIAFFNLPPICTIKIYTESGDLVKTIEHTNGSGLDSWGFLAEEYQASNSGQIIVSGVYIALFKTPDGKQTIQKFIIIR